MSKVAATVMAIVLAVAAGQVQAAVWHSESYDVADGYASGDGLNHHGWNRAPGSTAQVYGPSAHDGEHGAFQNPGTATRLADATNSHNTSQEQVSLWGHPAAELSGRSFRYYVSELKTSGLTGNLTDLLAYTGVKFEYVGPGGNGRPQASISYMNGVGAWIDTGVRVDQWRHPDSSFALYQVIFLVDVPSNTYQVTINDDSTGLLYTSPAPVGIYGGTLSALNGVAVAGIGGGQGGWDTLVFETIPEPVSALVLMLGFAGAAFRKTKN